jgi:copper/silver efflux system protein
MLPGIITWSVNNKFLVAIFTLFVVAGGIVALSRTPLEAIPDLSDVQVIVQTDYPGQAPLIVEDQVTYPIAAEMLKVPGAEVVRGYSFFGLSFVYIIFDDGTDLYWARSRVLEYLSAIQDQLPDGAQASLGPDATGLGWVYQYALEDTLGNHSLADLRAIQDWNLRYALTSVPGVSEVAAVGGFQRMYEITVNPENLRGYGISVSQIMQAVRVSNQDEGAMMLDLSDREFMVRALGYFQGPEDIENVVVGATASGTPIRVADIATVQFAPDVRRGAADLDGRGEVVGGIVVMRFGENALGVIDRVKEKLVEVEASLPEGVVIRPVYDRSDLILRAISTLREKLILEFLIVALICVLFLFHVRSALVAIITLPLAVLMAFIVMRGIGIGADIMSLGGIAIAIGTMVDAAIVMIENNHKHLERAATEKYAERGEEIPKRGFSTSIFSPRERWQMVLSSSKEVGPALFFALLIISVSFVPIFALEAQEGRLFKPLAWTNVLAMASAALLAVTLVPVAMGLFIRGRIRTENQNPLNRLLVAVYRPVIRVVLRYPWPVVSGAVAILLLTFIPFKQIGSEFMPPLHEGTILYMPTTLPGISIEAGRQVMQHQDSVLAAIPEVESVFGKIGRAETATDPAGLDMLETTIVLRPRDEWRPGMTPEKLVNEMDSLIDYPGFTNAWTMPIQGRIDMLATGIRTPVGVKIFGEDLAELERLGREVENAVSGVRGTRSVFAERAVTGYYLDIDIDRAAAARYGLNVGDIQMVVGAAVGGMPITRTVEGRERYGVRLRYPQELRDQPDKLAEVLIPVAQQRGTMAAAGMGGAGGMPGMGNMGGGQTAGGSASMGDGALGAGGAPGTRWGDGGGASRLTGEAGGVTQVPLGQVADIRMVRAPMAVRTEGAIPTAWVYVDVVDRDIGGYVTDARRMVDEMVELPPGYRIEWSGQYEYMERAQERLTLVVPAVLLIIFLLVYFNFRNVGSTLIVLLSVPLSLVGGIAFMAALGYNWSVATVVGFIALAGVATEIAIILVTYLNLAYETRRGEGRLRDLSDLAEAVREGVYLRLRPIIMTSSTLAIGLLPLLFGHGAGASVMRRIAAPMIGGMVSTVVLTLILIPAIYFLWKGYQLQRGTAGPDGPFEPAELPAGVE